MMGLPRLALWSPLLVLLFSVHSAMAIVLTNTAFALQIGVPFTITWAEASGAVTIDLYGGNSADELFAVQQIANSLGDGFFTWTPSADLPQRNAYAIVVSDGSGASAISFAFTFAAAAPPTTTSPTQQPQATTTQPPPTTSSKSNPTTSIITKLNEPTTTASNNTTPSHTTNPPPTGPPTGHPTSAPDRSEFPGSNLRGGTEDVLTLPAKIGIGVAAGVGMAVILAGSAFMVIRKNKELDRKAEAAAAGGGNTAELGGWKTLEKRPEASPSAIEMQMGRPGSAGTGPGGVGGKGIETGRVSQDGRLSVGGGRPKTPNMPRTPSPLAKEVGGSGSGSMPGAGTGSPGASGTR